MRSVFSIFFLFLTVASFAQRRVVVGVEGLFPFDPLSGRYLRESLPSVATYVADWRAHDGGMELVVLDSLVWGYRHYCMQVDTSLYGRVTRYLGVSEATGADSVAVDIFGFAQSRDFLDHFASDIQAIKRYFATPLRVFDTSMVYNPYTANDFESLFHTFQQEVTGADLSWFSPPNLHSKLPGEVYVEDIVKLLRYDNDLVVVELTGKELRGMVEKSLAARFFTIQGEGSDLLRHTLPAYLFATIGGECRYVANLSKNRGRRVENWPLDDTYIYSVAMNSYLAQGFKVTHNFGCYKTLIIRWLKTVKKPLKTTTHQQIQPHNTIQKIIRRESKSIFGNPE